MRRVQIPRGEEANEFVLDAARCSAADLLRHDARRERAEGVDFFGEAGGGEDVAMVCGEEGGEGGVYALEVGKRVCQEGEVRRRGRRADAGRGGGGCVGGGGGGGSGEDAGTAWGRERGVCAVGVGRAGSRGGDRVVDVSC